MLRETFASRIRQYRNILGLSQQKMANQLGIAKTTVINWEKSSGTGQPTWEQLEVLCSWSGLSPLYFVVPEDFSSDTFDLVLQIEALPREVQEGLKLVIRHSLRRSEG